MITMLLCDEDWIINVHHLHLLPPRPLVLGLTVHWCHQESLSTNVLMKDQEIPGPRN